MGYIKDVKIGNDTHLIEPILYGTCSTAADVAEKVVSIPNFELVSYVRIAVNFTYNNTVSNPTLNVNNTGAHGIYYYYKRGQSNSTTNVPGYSGMLYGIRYFIYYNSMWLLEDDALSLSKYTNDISYGTKTFNNSASSTKYTDLGNSYGGIGFHLISDTTNYSTVLTFGTYQGTNSSYTPIVTWSKETIIRTLAAPIAANDAANKKYVDDKFALALPLSGGTLTGALTLAADPTTNLGAATKQYVDTAVSSVTASIEVVRLI